MRSRFLNYSISLSFMVAIASPNLFASAFNELSQADQNRVQNGEQVAIYTSTAESVWPKCLVYEYVKADPEEAAAIFFDFESQKNYIANLTKSHISKQINKNTFEVEYSLTLPFPFGHEAYVVEDQISRYDSGRSYRLDWKLLHADTTKSSEGTARFEALGTGTLLAYYSYIIPGRTGSGLGWIVEKARQTVKDNVSKIVEQIETERLHDSALMNRQIDWLRSIL